MASHHRITSGTFGPLLSILCVDLGSFTLLLNPLISGENLKATPSSSWSSSCYLVPFTSYEGKPETFFGGRDRTIAQKHYCTNF